MANVDFEYLKKICEPVSQYIQEKFNPYTSIIITDSGVTLEETVAFVPMENGD